MLSKSEAYSVLELPYGANEAQVRSAFRRLSLKWHPDRNKSEEATTRFIQIHAAYDFLQRHLLKGKRPQFPNEPENENESIAEDPLEQACKNARMRYEEYLKSDRYQQDLTHENFNQFFGFLLSFLLVTALPVFLFLRFGISAIPVIIALILITSMFWFPAFRNFGKIEFGRLKGGFFKFYQESFIAEILVLSIAVFWMVAICFRVFIEPRYLITVFILLAATFFGIFFYKKIHFYNRYFAAISAAGLLIGLFFSINNVLGYNLRKETYTGIENGSMFPGVGNNSALQDEKWPTFRLPGNKYHQYPQIRFHLSGNKDERIEVSYIIGTGFFGFTYLADKQIGEKMTELPY